MLLVIGRMKLWSDLTCGPSGWFLAGHRPSPGIENQVLVHAHSSEIVAAIDDYGDNGSVLLTTAKLSEVLFAMVEPVSLTWSVTSLDVFRNRETCQVRTAEGKASHCLTSAQ